MTEKEKNSSNDILTDKQKIDKLYELLEIQYKRSCHIYNQGAMPGFFIEDIDADWERFVKENNIDQLR